ncbi:MAG: hypothetical protein SAK29_06665 [Scytonema sp. PMC 1069.18]|nr:hypothetical protein [Scytonema sp. PMC 1069.18]MEC4884041.1 hypothetical protein [Scytonema sp. PMC 1070.18]
MIDPSGIRPKDDKFIVKEVKQVGVYTIENAYEGVYDCLNSSDTDTSGQSGSDWDALDELQRLVSTEETPKSHNQTNQHNPGGVALKVNQTNQPRESKR